MATIIFVIFTIFIIFNIFIIFVIFIIFIIAASTFIAVLKTIDDCLDILPHDGFLLAIVFMTITAIEH